MTDITENTAPRQFTEAQIASALAGMGLDATTLEILGMVAIDLKDILDGDPDLELGGDELDSTLAEDDAGAGDYATMYETTGAGCSVSDPGEDEPDRERDDDDGPAWIERVNQTKPPLPFMDCPADIRNAEDSEPDDEDDAQSEDEPGFGLANRRWANRSGDGAGCAISDSDFEHDGAERGDGY